MKRKLVEYDDMRIWSYDLHDDAPLDNQSLEAFLNNINLFSNLETCRALVEECSLFLQEQCADPTVATLKEFLRSPLMRTFNTYSPQVCRMIINHMNKYPC